MHYWETNGVKYYYDRNLCNDKKYKFDFIKKVLEASERGRHRIYGSFSECIIPQIVVNQDVRDYCDA